MSSPIPPQSPQEERFRHHGSGDELFVIFIVNTILKILTLGIYHFWAKTRVRRYLWSQTSFDGERFEYTGLGGELFRGFLVVMGVYILFVIAFMLIPTDLQQIALIIVYPVFLTLIFFGLYSARRYMLSRTRLRGIRFGQSGSGFTYAWKMILYWILAILTLGLYIPFMHNNENAYKLNNTWFGSEQMQYDGEGKDLFKPFIIAYLLLIPTLGLSWFWYAAAQLRYTAEHIRFQKAELSFNATGGQLLWLVFSNLLLILVTLGLAIPWIWLRNIRFVCERLELVGELDYVAIKQNAETMPGMGEGIVEAFDLGGAI